MAIVLIKNVDQVACKLVKKRASCEDNYPHWLIDQSVTEDHIVGFLELAIKGPTHLAVWGLATKSAAPSVLHRVFANPPFYNV